MALRDQALGKVIFEAANVDLETTHLEFVILILVVLVLVVVLVVICFACFFIFSCFACILILILILIFLLVLLNYLPLPMNKLILLLPRSLLFLRFILTLFNNLLLKLL